ncbi:hypothetical protein H3V17_10075 [Bartonella sp. M0283]|uniref:hypothetical protein n=1 Tax=Bartonella sp. M0283 TaxID=2751016 RepID=UPI0018DCB1D4|nr:hypothetical protein [Bartonella sp. M0283]MBI0163989.1 hypothetical protein [Bartonella sp. M0283]
MVRRLNRLTSFLLDDGSANQLFKSRRNNICYDTISLIPMGTVFPLSGPWNDYALY